MPDSAVAVDATPPCRRGRMRATGPAAGGAGRPVPPTGLGTAFDRLPLQA
ncbi:hypothetical protein EV699_12413 [Plasticicumulans lactativorans]|uniref:Uncharacterized protein n=1 Tax=Plasticicumulans lactativorans TaxID=1133106 RepID=A0A4R2L2U4_9GAMM|nr:hypothetical protein [Plasticicumulans lactativorans]TCO78096.1 hypothetical protein EV699_12413 [Plasticicumulans lactativorans]